MTHRRATLHERDRLHRFHLDQEILTKGSSPDGRAELSQVDGATRWNSALWGSEADDFSESCSSHSHTHAYTHTESIEKWSRADRRRHNNLLTTK
ncbi:hypothetical protein Q1695_011214 [Nippostrongylus brasiliensis]|nr:hypothetical protein Q1695_011214 [Nippostrongylus brasiliensis]